MADYLKKLGLLPTNPPRELTALKPHQLNFVLGHIQGLQLSEIAEESSYTASYISEVLRSIAAKNIIQDFYSFQDQEFKALYNLSIDAVRRALNSEDDDVRLKAAKMFFQAHGKMNQKDFGEATAEDVVRRIMEIRLVEETPAR